VTKPARNATQDTPDTRDHLYEPALIKLAPERAPQVEREQILDQGSEGACTGFALAAVINHSALGYRPPAPEAIEPKTAPGVR